MRCGRIELDGVVDLRAGRPRGLEAHADLDALHRLHGHHRLRQAAVELFVPLRVRAESVGQALDADLDDAAQRVAGRLQPSINAATSSSRSGSSVYRMLLVAQRPLFCQRGRLAAESPTRRPAPRRQRP